MEVHEKLKLFHELYGLATLLFIRNLKTQIKETSINIIQELKKRTPKKVLIVGPGVSPYIYQLASIFDSHFIALDIRRYCLETLRCLGKPNKVEKMVKKIVEVYGLKKDEENEVMEIIETIVKTSKKIAQDTNYYPVRNYRSLSNKIDFIQGNVAYIPLRNLDAILMFNVIDYLELKDFLYLFKSINKSLNSKGFFCVSGPIQRLDTSYLRSLMNDKYHLIYLNENPDNSYEPLDFSLKNLIPKELKWKISRTEKYFCLYGEKN